MRAIWLSAIAPGHQCETIHQEENGTILQGVLGYSISGCITRLGRRFSRMAATRPCNQ